MNPDASHPGRRQPFIALSGMTVIWILLWGDVSWGNLAGGLLVSTVVLALFPLPSVRLHGRIRPLGVLRFALHFVGDLVVSSVQVAWVAVRPSRELRNAVVAVRLRVPSDFNLALTSEAVTLVPGSVTVEADRESATLYVHLLDVRDRAEVERLRHRVRALEGRLVRAIGSDEELRRLKVAEGRDMT
jgi:multicomponent Na+:H+ antiporter subunit E